MPIRSNAMHNSHLVIMALTIQRNRDLVNEFLQLTNLVANLRVIECFCGFFPNPVMDCRAVLQQM